MTGWHGRADAGRSVNGGGGSACRGTHHGPFGIKKILLSDYGTPG
jgi:hypothetical protein